MIYKAVCVGLLSALVCATTPVTAATAKFDCDTAAKRFSTVALPIAGQHIRVSGVVSSQLVRDDDRWAPKLSLYLAGATAQFGGFSVSRQPGQSWDVVLRYSGEESAPVGTLKKFDPTPFTLDVNAATGSVDLQLGPNLYHSTGTPFEADKLTLSCSTGNFLFDQISWDVVPN